MSLKDIYDYQNLKQCGKDVCKNNRWKPSVQNFEMLRILYTVRNSKRIKNKTFTMHKTYNFKLHERGKLRDIKAHNIQDRQVLKALCKYSIKPSIQNRILPNNAASQIGKGIDYSIAIFKHHLTKAYKRWSKNFYLVIWDYHNYFGSIPHNDILHTILLDEESMWLLNEYVNSFEGDVGIGIGGEPSQDIAIAYPSKIDRMISCESYVYGSGRYMDDGYAIVHTKDEARFLLNKILDKSKQFGLIINENRTKIYNMRKESVIWLKKKVYITDTGKIIMKLTKKNIKDEINALYFYKKLYDREIIDINYVKTNINCWFSYARKYNARQDMYKMAHLCMDLFGFEWDEIKILFKTGKGFIKTENKLTPIQKYKDSKEIIGNIIFANL